MEVILEHIHNLTRFLWQTIFLHKRHNASLNWSKDRREVQYYASVAAFEYLLFVCTAHHREEHTVHTDRCLYHIWRVALVELRVEVLNLLTTILSVLAKVEVSTAVDTFYLLESKWHLEFDVSSGVSVVSEFVVIVVAVVLVTHTKGFVPLEAELLPVLKPFHLLTWTNEELHLHLLKLTHTEHELACYYLVAECLTDLCDTKRNLHTARLLYVEVVHEYTLCSLRTEVNLHGTIGGRTHLGGEHEVELTHVGPVAGTRDWANDFFINNDLLEFLKVVVVEGSSESLVESVAFLYVGFYSLVGLLEHLLVEALAEAFACFGYFFLNLLVVLSELVLDKHVCAVAFFAILIIYEWIVECVHVT